MGMQDWLKKIKKTREEKTDDLTAYQAEVARKKSVYTAAEKRLTEFYRSEEGQLARAMLSETGKSVKLRTSIRELYQLAYSCEGFAVWHRPDDRPGSYVRATMSHVVDRIIEQIQNPAMPPEKIYGDPLRQAISSITRKPAFPTEEQVLTESEAMLNNLRTDLDKLANE